LVKEEKVKIVEELKEKIEKYLVIGIFDLYKLPTKVLKEVRKLEDIEVKVAKKNLIRIALESCKNEKLKELINLLPSQPGLIFSNKNPVELFKEIEKVKINTYAKAGDVASEDIVVKAGITNLMAGPAIGEFSRAKIPVKVEGGKIAIREDTTVVKKGEVISAEIASILRKLEIKPISLGLKLNCIFDGNLIYTSETLDFIRSLESKLREGYKNMLNLTTNIGWITKDSIRFILLKAYQNGMALDKVIG